MTTWRRIDRARPDWLRVQWEGRLSSLAVPLLEDLGEIPGVYVKTWDETWSKGSVEAHQSTWSLPVLQSFVASTVGGGLGVDARTLELAAPDLYPHQRAALHWLVSRGCGLLADEMGLGKTRVALRAADALTQPDAGRLIVGPTYVRDVWRTELERCGLLRHAGDFVALRGLDDEDASMLQRGRWWFIHYDILQAWSNRLNFNARGRARVAIVDEAHHLRNGRTRRAKHSCNATGTIPHRIVLTATPVANRPADLWSLLRVLHGPRAWGTPADFRRRYCGAAHDGFGLRDGEPTNVEELQHRLSGCYLRRTKADAGIQLPSFTRTVLRSDLTTPQRHEHDGVIARWGGSDRSRAIRNLLDALRRGSLRDETLQTLTRLRQITSAAKAPTTAHFAAAALAQGARPVIFVHERATAERLGALIDRGDHEACGSVVIHGGVSELQRGALLDAWRMRGGALVATYGVLREGVTLTESSLVMLHDLSWVPTDCLQAEARVHRIGQRVGTQSFWCVAPDSFDTLLAQVLAEKAAQQSALGLGEAAAAFGSVDLERAAGVQTVAEEVTSMFNAWGGL